MDHITCSHVIFLYDFVGGRTAACHHETDFHPDNGMETQAKLRTSSQILGFIFIPRRSMAGIETISEWIGV